jgi:macrolide transport system ATP-binding/permease protein
MKYAWRIYQRLAHAFPHEFKLAYGTDVEQLGQDVVEEVGRRQGIGGLARLIGDIAVRVPVEYLSEMRADLRYAWRMLVKSPGFALVGIISMGLAMGLTTNIYGTKWAMLFRNLPATANADRLVIPFPESADGDPMPVSYYYVEQYRQHKDLFSGVAAMRMSVPFNVSFGSAGEGRPERVFGKLVSPDYFAVMGVAAQRGRMLDPRLDKEGEAATVVISDRFWRTRMDTSPEAVGEVLRLNGQIATIVGIAPKDFQGAMAVNPAELFVPITAPAAIAPELSGDVLHDHQAKEFLALMCLASGVGIEKAEAGADAITRRLDAEDVTTLTRADKGRHIALLHAGSRVPMPRKIKPVLMGFLIVLMGLITSLACINLANMLIARGTTRRREVAIRLTVGASRFRLIRQMVAEGVLLSLLGGAAGLVVAYGMSLLSSRFMSPTAIPVDVNYPLDWRAAFFTFGVALVCGVGFSLAPALQATKPDLIPALKEGAAMRLPGYRRIGLRNLLMVTQVAASLMLLLLTGFMVIGINEQSSLDTKFDPRSTYMFSIDPVRDGYSPDKARDFFDKLPERLKGAVPVTNVALAAQPPYSDLEPTPMSAERADGTRAQQELVEESVGAGYFAALSEPMVAGREFNETDGRPGSGVSAVTGAGSMSDAGNGASDFAYPAILNERAARKLFGDENAIGKRLRDNSHAYEVVGMVRDLRGIDGISQAVVYVPLTEHDFSHPPAGGMAVLVRANAGTDTMAGIRNEIAFIDPKLNVFKMETLKDYLDQARAALKYSLQTYGGIGLFGLILAAIGLAGVTGYAVAQRRKEIAIRTALGSSRGQVMRLVLREGATMVAAGTVLGFLGAIGLAKLLSALASMIVDALRVGTDDPRLLIGAPLLLAAVALIACYVPARRSARISPLEALREE